MEQLIFHEILNVTKIRAYIQMSVTQSHNSRLGATHAIDISNNLSTPPTRARVAVMYLFLKSGRHIPVNFDEPLNVTKIRAYIRMSVT